jgi:5-methylcytosine-specific restriction protein A
VGAKAIVYSVTGSTPHHAYDAVEALLELKFTVRARTRNRTNGHRFKRYIESGQLIFDETAQDWQPDYSSVNSGLEGSPTTSSAVRFERSSALRKRAIQFHGLTCKICGFNFRQTYGDIGAGYIEVHHLQPLSEVGCEHEVNPRDDLIVLCSNCHRMIHRDGNPCLTLEELKSRMPEHNWYA